MATAAHAGRLNSIFQTAGGDGTASIARVAAGAASSAPPAATPSPPNSSQPTSASTGAVATAAHAGRRPLGGLVDRLMHAPIGRVSILALLGCRGVVGAPLVLIAGAISPAMAAGDDRTARDSEEPEYGSLANDCAAGHMQLPSAGALDATNTAAHAQADVNSNSGPTATDALDATLEESSNFLSPATHLAELDRLERVTMGSVTKMVLALLLASAASVVVWCRASRM